MLQQRLTCSSKLTPSPIILLLQSEPNQSHTLPTLIHQHGEVRRRLLHPPPHHLPHPHRRRLRQLSLHIRTRIHTLRTPISQLQPLRQCINHIRSSIRTPHQYHHSIQQRFNFQNLHALRSAGLRSLRARHDRNSFSIHSDVAIPYSST